MFKNYIECELKRMTAKDENKSEKELTPKIKKFCAIYAMLNDEIEAAVKAGYPYECAKATAKRLLKRGDVQKRIDKEIEKLADKYKIDRSGIITHLKNMLDWDLFELVEVQELKEVPKKENADSELVEERVIGQALLIDIEKLKELKAAGLTKYIISVSQTKYGIRIEIPKKTEIIDILNKMNGFYKPEEPKDDKQINLFFNIPRSEEIKPESEQQLENGYKVNVKVSETNININDEKN